MEPIPTVRVLQLLDRYAVILLDAYGVLVTTDRALPGAIRLLDHLHRTGKPYFVLTNDATKPPDVAAARYAGFGLTILPERIVSSGSLLAPYFAENRLRGRRCIVLGPEGAHHYVQEAGGIVVAPDQPFEVLVVADQTGFPFLETVDTVLTGLIRRIDRGDRVHLLLPNPDLVYPKPDGFGFTSGSVALIIEAALQLRYPNHEDLRFKALGKPQPRLYAEAARRCGHRDLVMIGDQLATDIAGANAFGIDSALVGGGVSVTPSPSTADGPRPSYLLAGLDDW
jgi:HAD superfamily hydrolase (TIGR01450 family)